MPDVFISYARSSAVQARAAAEALREAGYSVWYDQDLPSHRAYAEVIEEQLLSAKAVVVIWSAEAAKSQWVRAEANRAREDGKLVQLTLDRSGLPLPFDQIQCADLSGWTGQVPHPSWPKIETGVAELVSGQAVAPRLRGELPTAVEPLLAVLPFDAPAHDGEAQSLADGLSEEILQALAKARVVRVIGRTASFRYRGEAKAAAARALKASHVLDGAVRRMGGRTRISVQLTEAASGAALWGERFDRDAVDAFALQDELAERVCEAVRNILPVAPAVRDASGSAAAEEETPGDLSEGERRHVTVLSCSLSGSARLAGADPERWRAEVMRFQDAAAAAVARMDGHVAKYLGDGLEVHFGYPEAREDAAECAVRAGLAVVAAITELNDTSSGVAGLQVKVGVDAGMVVVARGIGNKVDLFGEALQNAAAIAAVAAPGAVMISGVVHDLVSGQFVLEGAVEGAERGDATRLYRVLRAGLASQRGDRARAAAPFVGREDELAQLEVRWRKVRAGEGQAALVLGDAGIGKTRLLAEFRERIRSDTHIWIESAGAPLHANTPFQAVIRMLDQGLGWRGEESTEERLALLEQSLSSADVRLAEAVQLIAEMLGLPAPPQFEPLVLSPDQKRARLLAALTGWVFSAPRGQPLVIVMEDLQWADPSTLELIQTLALQGAGAPIFLIMSARTEFRPTWPQRDHHTHITLGRLSDGNVRRLVEGMAGGAPLGGDALRKILRRTDGVPLFAEELARLVRSGRDLGEHAIPSSLRDSLGARLDRLGRAKEVAQLAAVLGREFSYELIAAVWSGPEDDLQNALNALVADEVFTARGLPPYATYTFKHSLMQDAAYDALLRSKRRELHSRVAHTIGSQFAPLERAQPELLARHWTEAGESEAAVAAWRDAGESAYARYAFKEAESAFRHSLESLADTPATPERDGLELDLASRLARVLTLTRGYAAPETVEAASRAKALAEKSGRLDQLIRQESRMWQATFTAGDYAGASAIADHIFELAQAAEQAPSYQLFAQNAQLQGAFYTGDLARAEAQFAQMSEVLKAQIAAGGKVNGAISIGVAALTAWMLGHSAKAEERLRRSAQYAEQSGDPYDLAMNLHFCGILSACRRDAKAADHFAGKLLELAESNGLSYARELARGTLAWAKAQLGDPETGFHLMRRSGEEATGALVGHTFGLTLSAEIRAMRGERRDAMETFERALNVNPQERVFRPFTLESRARFQLDGGETAAAEVDFREALLLAEEMGAQSLEIAAAEGLGRMLIARGDGSAARQLIEPLLSGGEAETTALRDLMAAAH